MLHYVISIQLLNCNEVCKKELYLMFSAIFYGEKEFGFAEVPDSERCAEPEEAKLKKRIMKYYINYHDNRL